MTENKQHRYTSLCATELHEYCTDDRCECSHHFETVILNQASHGDPRIAVLVGVSYECWQAMRAGKIADAQTLRQVITLASTRLGAPVTDAELDALAGLLGGALVSGAYAHWSRAEVVMALLDS